jgi:hypothetical protein
MFDNKWKTLGNIASHRKKALANTKSLWYNAKMTVVVVVCPFLEERPTRMYIKELFKEENI